jgi:hypothetical protein
LTFAVEWDFPTQNPAMFFVPSAGQPWLSSAVARLVDCLPTTNTQDSSSRYNRKHTNNLKSFASPYEAFFATFLQVDETPIAI